MSPCTSQIGNSLFKRSIISVKCCGLKGTHENIFLDMFSFAIICLSPEDCN